MIKETIESEQELLMKVGVVVEQCAKYDYWTRMSKPNLPELYYNVFCYIDYGNSTSLGHEAKIGTATIRYNGDISFSSHF